ncbi:hypothetical protein BLOT_001250, partial [Blomia tropicalis]
IIISTTMISAKQVKSCFIDSEINLKATVPCKQTNRLADWQTSTSSIVNVTVATSLLTRFYMGPQSPLVGCLPVGRTVFLSKSAYLEYLFTT